MVIGGLALAWPRAGWADLFDADPLLGPWPRQTARQLEVGRHPVTWRQRAAPEGLFAGVQFTAPLDHQAVWERATAVTDLGRVSPEVERVVTHEDGPNRQQIQVTIRVLWRRLTLMFDVEKEPPEAVRLRLPALPSATTPAARYLPRSEVRFRLTNRLIGEYRGACRFDE